MSDKSKNDRPYTLRMPEELYKRLARRAIDEGKRMNEIVNEILKQALESSPDEGKKGGAVEYRIDRKLCAASTLADPPPE